MAIPATVQASVKSAKAFAAKLLQWHRRDNHRSMPWKGEKDPYKIWLSEIILQQTRVEQGWAYYEKFIQHYPTVQDLAAAADNQVFKDWEGLGYYNRCKNLLHTARRITTESQGRFPADFDGLLQLKGIGSYTAAAISAFAFNLPHAVVDGNVFRVLSRLCGIDLPVDSTQGKAFFDELAAALLDRDHPALYNQAIMDFGATVCKPANPRCSDCPMRSVCVAYKTGTVNQLPVKEKILKKKVRHLTWLILEANSLYYVHKRPAGDIWQNLHEFYLVETLAKPQWNLQSVTDLVKHQLGLHPTEVKALGGLIQQLTHQKIIGEFYSVQLPSVPATLKGALWLPQADLQQLAFPKMLNDIELFGKKQKN